MGYELTISGLRRKRKELAQAIERRRDEIAHLRADLEAIERALIVFGVVDITIPPQPHNIMFGRSELRRIVLDELRKHGERTVREIALAVIERRGLEGRDYERVTKGVGKVLRTLVARGIVCREEQRERAWWRLVG